MGKLNDQNRSNTFSNVSDRSKKEHVAFRYSIRIIFSYKIILKDLSNILKIFPKLATSLINKQIKY